LQKNKLILNISKTETISFNNHNPPITIQYNLQQCSLKSS